MKFIEAYNEMLKGKKITRPCFKGYWYINGTNGFVTIHCKDDSEITEGFLTLTIQNTLAEDWQIYEENNLERVVNAYVK